MSTIGSTLNSINSTLLAEITKDLAASKASNSTNATPVSNASSSDKIDFSQVAQLFQQLQQLQQQNPDAFQQVMKDAVTELRAAAQQATDPNQAKFLNVLADKFQLAADSGDLSVLQPDSATQGAQGHHHHGHHAKKTDADSAAQTTNATSPYASATASVDTQSLWQSLFANQPAGGTGSQAQDLLSALLNSNSR